MAAEQVDYNQRSGISVWNVFSPDTVGGGSNDERLSVYSHCVQTTAGCNDTDADFYDRFVNPYTEPHFVS